MIRRSALYFTVLVLLLTSCGQPKGTPSTGSSSRNAPVGNSLTWQEQYDLGLRYLSEGNYQEAILAFTAAIEIDPKQAAVYVSRGDAYALSGETEDDLVAAQMDYEKAIELDDTITSAYIALADLYIRQGDLQKAEEVLRSGLGHGDDVELNKKLEDIFMQSMQTDRFVNQRGYIKFVRFDELESEVQVFIEKLLENPDDVDTMGAKLATEYVSMVEQNKIERTLRTIKDGYKIQLRLVGRGNSDIYGGSADIRPKDGTAYYYWAYMSEGQIYVNHGAGVCENWNWNGPFEMTSIATEGSSHYNSGNCVDCLRDGPIYKPGSDGSGYYEYYDLGQWTGRIIYEDGSEHIRNKREGDEDDVFIYLGRTSRSTYQGLWLW